MGLLLDIKTNNDIIGWVDLYDYKSLEDFINNIGSVEYEIINKKYNSLLLLAESVFIFDGKTVTNELIDFVHFFKDSLILGEKIDIDMVLAYTNFGISLNDYITLTYKAFNAYIGYFDSLYEMATKEGQNRGVGAWADKYFDWDLFAKDLMVDRVNFDNHYFIKEG